MAVARSLVRHVGISTLRRSDGVSRFIDSPASASCDALRNAIRQLENRFHNSCGPIQFIEDPGKLSFSKLERALLGDSLLSVAASGVKHEGAQRLPFDRGGTSEYIVDLWVDS